MEKKTSPESSARFEDVTEFTDRALASECVPAKRRVTTSAPGIPLDLALAITAALFPRWGLADYMGQLTGEFDARQIPQVSVISSKMRKLADLYVERAPQLFKVLAPEMETPFQTYNKDSRIGWPDFNRSLNKAELAFEAYMQEARTGRFLNGCFTTMNVRLQPESNRDRQYQYVDDHGRVYDRTLLDRERGRAIRLRDSVTGETDLYWLRLSRTRLVFNLPLPNLALQLLDNALHHALLRHGAHRHNMYGFRTSNRVRKHVLALDTRHMERFTAAIIETRTKLFGGHYDAQHSKMAEGGFLAPSDTRRRYFRLRKPTPGSLVQFASGHSGVASSQKEINDLIMADCLVKNWGYDWESALLAVLSGSFKELDYMNYGDDNFWSSDNPAYLETAANHFAEYLDVEEETPSAFLGFQWSPEERRFLLPSRSYLLKTYLNERAPLPPFRNLPYFGWVEKRKTYLSYGRREELLRLYAEEEKLLEAAGLPWKEIFRRASGEAQSLRDTRLSRNALFGKFYLMSPEELVSTGEYDGLKPELARPYLLHMAADGIFKEHTFPLPQGRKDH